MEGLEKDFTNAGILALCYTLDVIKPKNLWICGLDFYSKDYIFRRSSNSTKFTTKKNARF